MIATRPPGTGSLYEKHGAYFGRGRTFDGRLLNCKIGRRATG